MIELKKSLLKKAGARGLCVTDKYITNGHFCLKLENLSPKTILDIKEIQLRVPGNIVASDEAIEKLFPVDSTTEFRKTNLLMEKNKKLYRYYENDDKKFLTISEEYVILFNIETLNSSGGERVPHYINNWLEGNIIMGTVLSSTNPDAFTAFEKTIKNLIKGE